MHKWDWDWTLESKFKAMCEELGGTSTSGSSLFNNKGIGREPSFLGCELLDEYDDFKAFAHWLNKQPRGHKTKTLNAVYEYDNGSDLFTTEFEVVGEKPRKTLKVSNKRHISSGESLEDYLREELNVPAEQEHTNWGINFDAICDDASSKKIIDEIKQPYLHPHTSLDVDFNSNDEAYYTKASINIPIKEGSVFSSVLKDATEAVEQTTVKSNDAFYKKLEEEITRVGRRP